MKNCIVICRTYGRHGDHADRLIGIGGPEGCVMTEAESLRVARSSTGPTSSASAYSFDSEADALTYTRARHRWVSTGSLSARLPIGIPLPKLISEVTA